MEALFGRGDVPRAVALLHEGVNVAEKAGSGVLVAGWQTSIALALAGLNDEGTIRPRTSKPSTTTRHIRRPTTAQLHLSAAPQCVCAVTLLGVAQRAAP